MLHAIAQRHRQGVDVPSSMKWLGVDKGRVSSMCLVAIETKSGHIGHGITYLAEGTTVAHIVNAVAGPAIVGADAMAHERVSQALYWALTGAAQSGFACNAMGAIDVALWDIKGKGWASRSGASSARPAIRSRSSHARSAQSRRRGAGPHGRQPRQARLQGIKIQVGRPGLDQRSGARPLDDIIKDDLGRLRAMRDALGNGIEIAIDGSSRFDLPTPSSWPSKPRNTASPGTRSRCCRTTYD